MTTINDRFRALSPLMSEANRPTEFLLTPTLPNNRTPEQVRQIEQDIKRAFELAPHVKPLERG